MAEQPVHMTALTNTMAGVAYDRILPTKLKSMSPSPELQRAHIIVCVVRLTRMPGDSGPPLGVVHSVQHHVHTVDAGERQLTAIAFCCAMVTLRESADAHSDIRRMTIEAAMVAARLSRGACAAVARISSAAQSRAVPADRMAAHVVGGPSPTMCWVASSRLCVGIDHFPIGAAWCAKNASGDSTGGGGGSDRAGSATKPQARARARGSHAARSPLRTYAINSRSAAWPSRLVKPAVAKRAMGHDAYTVARMVGGAGFDPTYAPSQNRETTDRAIVLHGVFPTHAKNRLMT
jgi:hypothetical protein